MFSIQVKNLLKNLSLDCCYSLWEQRYYLCMLENTGFKKKLYNDHYLYPMLFRKTHVKIKGKTAMWVFVIAPFSFRFQSFI